MFMLHHAVYAWTFVVIIYNHRMSVYVYVEPVHLSRKTLQYHSFIALALLLVLRTRNNMWQWTRDISKVSSFYYGNKVFIVY